jgi:hypothetical protein
MDEGVAKLLPKEVQARCSELCETLGIPLKPFSRRGQDTLTQGAAFAFSIRRCRRLAADAPSLFHLPPFLCCYGSGFTVGEGCSLGGFVELLNPVIRRRWPAFVELVPGCYGHISGGGVDVIQIPG